MPTLSQFEITIAENKVEVAVTRKPIKNVYIRFDRSTSQFRVSAPHQLSDADIRATVLNHQQWLLRRLGETRRFPHPVARAPVTGERVRLFGADRAIRVIECAGAPHVDLDENGTINVQVRPGANLRLRATLLDRWLRHQLEIEIARLILIWEPKLGVNVSGFKVRRMRTRWGSCNVAARRININLELVHRPARCLEYVVVHEMVHLLERGHNRRFYGLMNHFLPDWRSARELLRHEPPFW